MAKKDKKVEEKTAEQPEETGGESKQEFIDEDSDGNRLLPGQEIPVAAEVKPLIAQAKRVELVLKKDFAVARDALVTGQAELSRLAHENIAHFSEPDENGKRTYRFGKVVIEITFEKEKIKTKIEDDEE